MRINKLQALATFAAALFVIPATTTLGATLDLAGGGDLHVLGAEAKDRLGMDVAVGDFNDDGIDNLLLGAQQANGVGFFSECVGKAFVIFGSAALGGTVNMATAIPGFTVVGMERDDRLGVSVASGDVNGDGIDDMLLGAPFADGVFNAKKSSGEVFVVFGSTSLGGVLDLSMDSADLRIIGADAGDVLGTPLAAGDVNDDNIDDLILGAFGADAAGNAKSSAGETHVLFGSSSLGGTWDLGTTAADFSILGADAGDALGTAVASGDVNDDGIHDILVSAANASGPGNARGSAGEAYAVFGSRTLSGTLDLGTTAADVNIIGADANDQLGIRLTYGDFNDDRIDDILVGAFQSGGQGNGKPFAGEAHVIAGSGSLGGTIDLSSTLPTFSVFGAEEDDMLGVRVGSGDFNDDGIHDLFLASSFADAAANTRPMAGETYVVFGQSGLSGSLDLGTTGADVTVLGAGSGDLLGTLPLSSGDLNDDGGQDLLLGAVHADAAADAKSDAGEVYVVFGSVMASDLDALVEAVEDLPLSDFKSTGPGLQNAMLDILGEIDALLDDGDDDTAVRKLRNLRRRVDGCGAGADRNDWIIDCESQTEIRTLLDEVINDLTGMSEPESLSLSRAWGLGENQGASR